MVISMTTVVVVVMLMRKLMVVAQAKRRVFFAVAVVALVVHVFRVAIAAATLRMVVVVEGDVPFLADSHR